MQCSVSTFFPTLCKPCEKISPCCLVLLKRCFGIIRPFSLLAGELPGIFHWEILRSKRGSIFVLWLQRQTVMRAHSLKLSLSISRGVRTGISLLGTASTFASAHHLPAWRPELPSQFYSNGSQ